MKAARLERFTGGTAAGWLIAWLFVFLAATLVATVFATQWYSSQGPHGRGGDWPGLISHALSDWWVWAALAPGVFAVAVRSPLDRRPRAASLGVHLAAALLFAGAHVAAVSLIEPLLHAQPLEHGLSARFSHLVRQKIGPDLVVYAALTGLAHIIMLRRRLAGRDRAAAKLRAELVEAHLAALRFQLNPHFLFNALNTISGLVHHEPALADKAIADLGDILRNSLQQHGQTVPLSQEMEIVERYLGIERLRLGDRLEVQMDIDDAALALAVPVFAVQLLAENAVRHAIEPSARGGRLKIAARRIAAGLEIVVEDHGRDRSAPAPKGHGIGLANIRGRLQHLFEGAARLETEALEDGTRVRLTLPA